MQLTGDQILSILTIKERVPAIQATIISVGIKTFIDIYSSENAYFNECFMVINEILPNCERGEFKVFDDKDGSFCVHHKIIDPSGAIITLYMYKKPGQKEIAPLPEGAIEELTHLDNTTDMEVQTNA